MIEIKVAGRSAACTGAELLTSGSVGMQAKFTFDDAWDALAKTAVFIAGDTTRDVLLTGDTCTIPWEVLRYPGTDMIVGVYGTNGGTLVIPTIYAHVGRVKCGTDPSGDEGEEPTPTLVEQIMAAAGMAVETANSVREDADNGVFDGERGPRGYSGVYVGETEPEDDEVKVWVQPRGDSYGPSNTQNGGVPSGLITDMQEILRAVAYYSSDVSALISGLSRYAGQGGDTPSAGHPISVSYSGITATVNNLKSLDVSYSGTTATIGA